MFSSKKKFGPILFKEDSSIPEQIKFLKNSSDPDAGRKISLLEIGNRGEDRVLYELKSSSIDMFILRDLCLSCSNDVDAQIDFLVITKTLIFVLECKNLIGNIEIDSTGAFIRNYKLNGENIREGIYSPITQNERHLRAIYALFSQADKKTRRLLHCNTERDFDKNYQSLIVLANPKTCIKNASDDVSISSQLVRADLLIQTIEKFCEASNHKKRNDKECREIAEIFSHVHTPRLVKSEPILMPMQSEISTTKTNILHTSSSNEMICPRCKEKLSYGKYGYYCPNNDVCGAKIGRIKGIRLHKDQLHSLLSNNPILLNINGEEKIIQPELKTYKMQNGRIIYCWKILE